MNMLKFLQSHLEVENLDLGTDVALLMLNRKEDKLTVVEFAWLAMFAYTQLGIHHNPQYILAGE